MKEKILILSMFSLITTLAHASPCSSSSNATNPDGSVTLKNPVLLRGDQTLPISENAVGASYVCRLFGFDSYLDQSEYLNTTSSTVATLNADGSFNAIVSGESITETSCFNKSDFKTAKAADSIKKNPDNSFTISNPKLLHGDGTFPISENVYGAPYVCRLFGFDSYLDQSEYLNTTNSTVATLNADGSFNATASGESITEITCFQSGQLQNVSEAGNVIYISGQRQDPDSFKQDGIILKNLN